MAITADQMILILSLNGINNTTLGLKTASWDGGVTVALGTNSPHGPKVSKMVHKLPRYFANSNEHDAVDKFK